MLKRPSGARGAKLFLDIRVIPMAVNVAGALEVALDRASVRTGIRPSVILAGLVGGLSFVMVRLLRQERSMRDAGRRRLTVD